jgi:hypothetical protein
VYKSRFSPSFQVQHADDGTMTAPESTAAAVTIFQVPAAVQLPAIYYVPVYASGPPSPMTNYPLLVISAVFSCPQAAANLL